MKTIYSKIGPEKLRKLVDAFYDRVFVSEISHLFKTDKSLIKDKQFMFLTQFLGGPQLYSNTYGHPKMRMRHFPHAIDENAMNVWLKCMKEAIEASDIDQELKEPLYNCFPKLAAHMQNR